MKLLTEANEYGLRVVAWMAQHPGEAFKVKDLAVQIRAAPGYLIKVMQSLAKAGILSGRRGTRGGFTLQADPRRLTALDIIQAIDGFERIASCPLALTAHASTLCPIHRCIDDAMEQLEQAFRKLVIQDVIQQLSSPDFQCERLLSLRILARERPESIPPKC